MNATLKKLTVAFISPSDYLVFLLKSHCGCFAPPCRDAAVFLTRRPKIVNGIEMEAASFSLSLSLFRSLSFTRGLESQNI